MKPRLVGLIPRAFRDRYGEELEELLSDSRSAFRDSADVIMLAIRLHLENLMPVTLRILGMASILFGMFASGYATHDLSRGAEEIHRHWWSTAPIVFSLAGGVLVVVSHHLSRHRSQPLPPAD